MTFTDSKWTRKNMFDPATVEKSHMTLRDRLKLLFKRGRWAVDWDAEGTTLTKYKVMNDRIYVLYVRRWR